MLTEAEKKWLETRLQNLKVSGWFSCTEGELIPLVNFHRKHLNSDWQDAAEFEARVAASIAQDAYNCAQDEMLFQHQEGDRPQGWYILRDARLVVEEEMEKEK